MTGRLAVVIPTFQPDVGQLRSLVGELVDAGLPVVVSDDGSPGPGDWGLPEGCVVIRHVENRGIARGLNDGLEDARTRNVPWLLTLDQDSSLPQDYVEHVLAQAELAVGILGADRVGAVGAGEIDDASGPVRYPVSWLTGLPTTEEVIQTGTVWSVVALREIGGFDESLGIDAVDAAACLRMREAGRHIVVAPAARINHRIGNARQVCFLGRTVMSTGHSAERRETMVRNRLRLAPAEFRQSPKHALRTLRRLGVGTLLALTVEDGRWRKAKATARGISGALHRDRTDSPPAVR